MGDLLQRKNNSGGRQDGPMDTTRPDKSMRVVRARVDVSMEELIPLHEDKRKDGVPINEGQSLWLTLNP